MYVIKKTHPVMLYFMECINDSLFGILNIQRCNPLRDIFIVAKKNRVPRIKENLYYFDEINGTFINARGCIKSSNFFGNSFWLTHRFQAMP